MPKISGSGSGDPGAKDKGSGAGAVGGSSILGKLIGGGGQAPGGKSKVPAYVGNDLLERLRDTVVALQRNPKVEIPPVSLSAFVEAAIESAVEEAEAQYNDGDRFPARPNAKLKTGPPVG
ncbi:hypothetical protein NX794_33150 [Streptomyces sp. LP11]|uniref:Uncharacterized protein n=1 Tax=Streptomyces pyxinicus TaxID=2970331 RepID=A0ABT2BC62_9ACTN|nr:hypothetical protein [Streptomyces sp. LP11]MCS0606020.1 hypothetical protein [Streptomyces sp. LP11]